MPKPSPEPNDRSQMTHITTYNKIKNIINFIDDFSTSNIHMEFRRRTDVVRCAIQLTN